MFSSCCSAQRFNVGLIFVVLSTIPISKKTALIRIWEHSKTRYKDDEKDVNTALFGREK